ncbi:MAG: hypothetical protein AUI95_03980 [Crenarchaeota archaeon 13_1_40CM_3_52_4]|nr:MAG: hypothetical protein AUI95_03980 [Crenarchaeota archaeon 13_1_40CM_3_52_4]
MFFGMIVSLASLPAFPEAYADTDASAGAWYPAGPQMNTLSISEFASQLAEYDALTLSGDIDLMDQPLTPAQMAICPLGGPPPGFLCTTPDAVGNVYGRSGSWPLGGAVPGISGAVAPGTAGLPNFFNWLNAYSDTPAVPGTIRQGFFPAVGSLNPFTAPVAPPQDFRILSSMVYDTLLKANPLCNQVPPAASGVPACPSMVQALDWMTDSHAVVCFPGGPACVPATLGYTPPPGTVYSLHIQLRQGPRWQDNLAPVTAWDVKYTYLNLFFNGAPQAGPLAALIGVQVWGLFSLDFNFGAAIGDLPMGGITIMPGSLWSACGAAAWYANIGGSNIAGNALVAAPEDGCIGTFGPCPGSSTPAGCVGAIGGLSYAAPGFDPLMNGLLVGSGPWTCENTGANPGVPLGTIGTGCSIDNTQAPIAALGDFTLIRTGCMITPAGVGCVAPAGRGTINGFSVYDYFRSSGFLALYIWSGMWGQNPDSLKLATANACRSTAPSANCSHWAQGIGYPNANTNLGAMGILQLVRVKIFKGVSWIAFSTERTTGTLVPLPVACGPGYQVPGTTSASFTCPVTGSWTTTVLPGIGAYPPTLNEVGSVPATLTPAMPIGGPNGAYTNCATQPSPPAWNPNGAWNPVGLPANGFLADYPGGGYDC